MQTVLKLLFIENYLLAITFYNRIDKLMLVLPPSFKSIGLIINSKDIIFQT